MAIQRVDNYAAGFIRAGAQAVVAEAHMGPAYYVRSLLRSQDSIEQIWRVLAQQQRQHDDARQRAIAGLLRAARSRPLEQRLLPVAGVAGRELEPGPARARPARSAVAVDPAAGAGDAVAGVAGPHVRPGQRPLAADRDARGPSWSSRSANKGAKKIPEGTQVGVRWDPLVLDARPRRRRAPRRRRRPPSPAAVARRPRRRRAASPAPSTSPAPIDPPDVDLVVPEQLGLGRHARPGRTPAAAGSTSASPTRPRPACTGWS